eukprot:262694-Chlamydomonas_euryale.AAC.3
MPATPSPNSVGRPGEEAMGDAASRSFTASCGGWQETCGDGSHGGSRRSGGSGGGGGSYSLAASARALARVASYVPALLRSCQPSCQPSFGEPNPRVSRHVAGACSVVDPLPAGGSSASMAYALPVWRILC